MGTLETRGPGPAPVRPRRWPDDHAVNPRARAPTSGQRCWPPVRHSTFATASSPSPHHRHTPARRSGSSSRSRTANARSRSELGRPCWPGAAENRQAVATVGIVKTPEQLPGQRRLHVLDPATHLVAYDPAVDDQDLLLAAYHLLRAHAWQKALVSRPNRRIDLAALRAVAADLANALAGFDALTRHHNAARRSIDQADKAATALRADLQTRVDNTRQLLNGPAGTPGGTAAA